jgi:hypothetical protein
VDLDELWQRVRSGAANVAGVRYQLAVTAYLLAAARTPLAITKLVPEGLEDVDCELADGAPLLIQTKDRAGGDGRFGPSELRAALAHAADALRLDGGARLAVVTDAHLVGGLAETGFEHSVADVPAAAASLARSGEPHDHELFRLLPRTHLVRLEWHDVHEQTRQLLATSYELRPAVASIAYATLLEDMTGAAADQRGTTRDTARQFLPSDLDAMVHRIRELVDLEQLERAEREGLVAPLDFTRPLPLPLDRFLLGVDVEPGHIAANLDVLRAGELAEIFTGLHDDQYVLIAGPSGAGKSALLWRAAYELGGRFRLLRLRRLDTPQVPELLRYLEAQRPSRQTPVLVCGDNLGRPAVAAWEEAVDRMLELPGVHVLGAVREEDFRASLGRGRARVVRPVLGARLAAELAAQLEQRHVPFVLEPGEALARAEGLLMEFIALLIAGRRLRDIVNAQVEERLAAERVIERELLRYVSAAHVYTVDLPASALDALVPAPTTIPAALQRLEDEFLVKRAAGDRWRGLHELRSRVVTTRLHQLPPPSEGETIARLLPVVDTRDRRTLMVGAALAELDLSPLAAAAAQILASPDLEAAAAFAVLDGLLEAEEVRHARACLAFVRRQAPEHDAVAILPLLQAVRDGGVRPFAGLPNGDRIDALAAALPARPPSVAAEVAARMPESSIAAAMAASPVAQAVELLELLAFLGRPVPTDAGSALIDRARVAGATGLMTRAIAAVAEATPETRSQLARIAGPVESRLDAIAELRRDVLRWELSGSDDQMTVNVAAAEQGEEKLNDRLVGICRLIYDACPEVTQVNARALAADGSPSSSPDSKKSPLRKYVPNPVRQIRRNLAFQDAIGRLTAADSWSTRLRSQEVLVREISTGLEEAIPRLLNPHDNPSRRRSWYEAIERIGQAVYLLPSVPLAPSSSVGRDDLASDVLKSLYHGLSQLARAVDADRFDNLWGIGSQFQDALEKIVAGSEATAGVGVEARDWPIVRRLLAQLGGLRDISVLMASLLLALHHDRHLLHRVLRGGMETWRDAAARVVANARETILRQEREALATAMAGIPCELKRLERPGPGRVRLVDDLWLVLHKIEHLSQVNERLLGLPEDMRLALVLRTYAVGTAVGLVTPGGTRRLGYRDVEPSVYPVRWSEACALAEEAGVPHLTSGAIDEVLRAGEAIRGAANRAGHYLLRERRFSREPERVAAIAAIAAARGEVVKIGGAEPRALLIEALELVAGELAEPQEDAPAAESPQTGFRSEQALAAKLQAAFAASTFTAALGDLVSRLTPRPAGEPRPGLEQS